MLTLYYAPGACSMAAHIVLEESGEKYQPQKVDLAGGEQRTEAYLKINPLGRVPALRLDDGQPLPENTAILPYLGKRFGLWPTDPLAEAKALSLIGFFAASGLVSMWVSNTATALMLMPVAITVLRAVLPSGGAPRSVAERNFAACLVLAVAYGASIGGVGTTSFRSPPCRTSSDSRRSRRSSPASPSCSTSTRTCPSSSAIASAPRCSDRSCPWSTGSRGHRPPLPTSSSRSTSRSGCCRSRVAFRPRRSTSS